LGILNRAGIPPRDELRPARAGAFRLSNLKVWNPGQQAVTAALDVRDGLITAITRDAQEAAGEFAGCYATPGLVDMHVHLPPDNALRLTPLMALLYLSHGVTAIREAGDLDGTAINAAKRLQASVRFPLPRLFYCGPFITAGRPTFRNSILLRSPDDATRAARRVKELGATFLKCYDNLSREMIDALNRACQRESLKTMGHVPAALTYEGSGIAEVQHFFGVPRPDTLARPALLNRACDWQAVGDRRMQEVVDATLRLGIANTPTIAAISSLLAYEDFSAACDGKAAQLMPPFYRNVIWNPDHGGLNVRVSQDYLATRVRDAIAKKQTLTRMLYQRGAPLYLGTDTGQPFTAPGVSLLEEFRLFVDAGIPFAEVWRLATAAAGERLGPVGLGTIAVGAPADFLIFASDPSQAVPDPTNLLAVVADGKLYRKRDLDRAIADRLDYYGAPLVRALANRAAKQALARALGRAA
jgi:hypothetical protein